MKTSLSASAWQIKLRIILAAPVKASAVDLHGVEILRAPRNFLSRAREGLPDRRLLVGRNAGQRFSSAKNSFSDVLFAISNIVEEGFMGSEENEGLDIFPGGKTLKNRYNALHFCQ
jgi:hypothetical protein